ncbi:MAG: T9SS type A sorting domain-containing protein [Saprospiraceae bacterium]|nr:T9SS type A sorting domain-containing protein [Saprospiraceae bacterium]MDZ4702302.1 T9SS type A sorting domain-containing protein [Saprospiraceae bacterium]
MNKVLIVLALLAQMSPRAAGQALIAGSTGNDALNATAIALDGSVYAAGTYNAALNLGGTTLTNSGGQDFLLLKTTPAGTLDWAVSGGSFLDEESAGVAAHPQGGVVCAGAFWFTAQFGDLQLEAAQNPKAIFLIRYNSTGQPQWGKVIDGSSLKAAGDLAIAPDGSVYLSGFFQGQLVFGTDTTLTAHGNTDFFLAKFTADGQFIWALNCGGQEDTRSEALAVDPATGDVVASGFYDKQAQFGDQTLVANTSDRDVFVTRFNADGQVLWARRAGGVHDDNVSDIAIAATGHIYLTGSFIGVMNLADGFSIQSLNGIPDFYLLRYAPDGTPLLARSMGGALQEQATGIAIHGETITISGYFEGSMTIDGFSLTTNNGQVRAFLAAFDPALQSIHIEALNGAGDALALSLVPDGTGQIWASGSFRQSIQFGNQPYPAVGGFDAFLARLNLVTTTDIPVKPELEIFVFPNPANDTCTLQTPWANYEVLLFDAAGRQVFSGRNTRELFLGNYPSGTYTLYLRSPKGRAVRKIIVP